ncbi:hypothetical protein BLNAU_19641 [Blattamonas nauphoetae]|uniref:Fragile site-associated protein C-terminal domain-containing protein n=1 Tax=Blattamonas nauphoetae TaxID=2049346 RepID=A0ABQ9X0Z4_9EUKA|nr:hypothetical protein BLNAU_19641 [Blattamonas nauphoetae]
MHSSLNLFLHSPHQFPIDQRNSTSPSTSSPLTSMIVSSPNTFVQPSPFAVSIENEKLRSPSSAISHTTYYSPTSNIERPKPLDSILDQSPSAAFYSGTIPTEFQNLSIFDSTPNSTTLSSARQSRDFPFVVEPFPFHQNLNPTQYRTLPSSQTVAQAAESIKPYSPFVPFNPPHLLPLPPQLSPPTTTITFTATNTLPILPQQEEEQSQSRPMRHQRHPLLYPPSVEPQPMRGKKALQTSKSNGPLPKQFNLNQIWFNSNANIIPIFGKMSFASFQFRWRSLVIQFQSSIGDFLGEDSDESISYDATNRPFRVKIKSNTISQIDHLPYALDSDDNITSFFADSKRVFHFDRNKPRPPSPDSPDEHTQARYDVFIRMSEIPKLQDVIAQPKKNYKVSDSRRTIPGTDVSKLGRRLVIRLIDEEVVLGAATESLDEFFRLDSKLEDVESLFLYSGLDIVLDCTIRFIHTNTQTLADLPPTRLSQSTTDEPGDISFRTPTIRLIRNQTNHPPTPRPSSPKIVISKHKPNMLPFPGPYPSLLYSERHLHRQPQLFLSKQIRDANSNNRTRKICNNGNVQYFMTETPIVGHIYIEESSKHTKFVTHCSIDKFNENEKYFRGEDPSTSSLHSPEQQSQGFSDFSLLSNLFNIPGLLRAPLTGNFHPRAPPALSSSGSRTDYHDTLTKLAQLLVNILYAIPICIPSFALSIPLIDTLINTSHQVRANMEEMAVSIAPESFLAHAYQADTPLSEIDFGLVDPPPPDLETHSTFYPRIARNLGHNIAFGSRVNSSLLAMSMTTMDSFNAFNNMLLLNLRSIFHPDQSNSDLTENDRTFLEYLSKRDKEENNQVEIGAISSNLLFHTRQHPYPYNEKTAPEQTIIFSHRPPTESGYDYSASILSPRFFVLNGLIPILDRIFDSFILMDEKTFTSESELGEGRSLFFEDDPRADQNIQDFQIQIDDGPGMDDNDDDDLTINSILADDLLFPHSTPLSPPPDTPPLEERESTRPQTPPSRHSAFRLSLRMQLFRLCFAMLDFTADNLFVLSFFFTRQEMQSEKWWCERDLEGANSDEEENHQNSISGQYHPSSGKRDKHRHRLNQLHSPSSDFHDLLEEDESPVLPDAEDDQVEVVSPQHGISSDLLLPPQQPRFIPTISQTLLSSFPPHTPPARQAVDIQSARTQRTPLSSNPICLPPLRMYPSPHHDQLGCDGMIKASEWNLIETFPASDALPNPQETTYFDSLPLLQQVNMIKSDKFNKRIEMFTPQWMDDHWMKHDRSSRLHVIGMEMNKYHALTVKRLTLRGKAKEDEAIRMKKKVQEELQMRRTSSEQTGYGLRGPYRIPTSNQPLTHETQLKTEALRHGMGLITKMVRWMMHEPNIDALSWICGTINAVFRQSIPIGWILVRGGVVDIALRCLWHSMQISQKSTQIHATTFSGTTPNPYFRKSPYNFGPTAETFVVRAMMHSLGDIINMNPVSLLVLEAELKRTNKMDTFISLLLHEPDVCVLFNRYLVLTLGSGLSPQYSQHSKVSTNQTQPDNPSQFGSYDFPSSIMLPHTFDFVCSPPKPFFLHPIFTPASKSNPYSVASSALFQFLRENRDELFLKYFSLPYTIASMDVVYWCGTGIAYCLSFLPTELRAAMRHADTIPVEIDRTMIGEWRGKQTMEHTFDFRNKDQKEMDDEQTEHDPRWSHPSEPIPLFKHDLIKILPPEMAAYFGDFDNHLRPFTILSNMVVLLRIWIRLHDFRTHDFHSYARVMGFTTADLRRIVDWIISEAESVWQELRQNDR